MASIPATQKAAWVTDPGPNGHIAFRDDVPVGKPGEHEVLVKLEYSGIWFVNPFHHL